MESRKPLDKLRLSTLLAAGVKRQWRRGKQVENFKFLQLGISQVPCPLCIKSADELWFGACSNWNNCARIPCPCNRAAYVG